MERRFRKASRFERLNLVKALDSNRSDRSGRSNRTTRTTSALNAPCLWKNQPQRLDDRRSGSCPSGERQQSLLLRSNPRRLGASTMWPFTRALTKCPQGQRPSTETGKGRANGAHGPYALGAIPTRPGSREPSLPSVQAKIPIRERYAVEFLARRIKILKPRDISLESNTTVGKALTPRSPWTLHSAATAPKFRCRGKKRFFSSKA